MIITKKQSLSKDTKVELLFTLYRIEDELGFSKTINYLQKGDEN